MKVDALRHQLLAKQDWSLCVKKSDHELESEGDTIPQFCGCLAKNKSVGLSTPTSPVLKRDGVQSEDWNALCLLQHRNALLALTETSKRCGIVCFGAVLDLIHLRFQHNKAKRVFAAAGQLVCVVNPTHNLKRQPSKHKGQRVCEGHLMGEGVRLSDTTERCNRAGEGTGLIPGRRTKIPQAA
ncbi:hypothetical protein MJG53_009779 [Ovis ammon polii x Ovis aries]|uniref:Uncharacterized protein n=1 Tax=Ovis ammon polii x Ovis aries TaxID=2918886 RepID=A0ACB9UV31_9CETA|nr:hypothetical protein MJG53_009779 [Ovis ammon polii x Ovis aries]